MSTFTLSSPDLSDCRNPTIPMQFIYDSFGCTGKNQSPALIWNNPPQETKSFSLTVFDPDAPTGSGFWHWQIYNIPATMTSLPTNASGNIDSIAPTAKQTRNDYGNEGYGGPCPPAGDAPHRYSFTLHALNIENLDLPLYPSAALAGFMINSHTIETAKLIIPYGR